ncbi:YfiR family protein [Thiocystis violacea]|uniref:YfiR family protein n=1 Tax=Thiocystis violacea TaxID=13725 RepID=UPI0019057513|nr:YfiR family protein [Thiocystis violacea]MBK1717791.1 hypothetical protein [Thiocystis violacea]
MPPRTQGDRFRRRVGAVAGLLLAWLATLAPALALAQVEEAELSAAYLYNFSKFVHWPATALSDSSNALVLCVYGRPGSAGEAIGALDGKPAQGHRIRVERLARGDTFKGCQIVYVSDSERPFLSPLLRTLANQPALTVSDIPGFASAGGMIGLVMVDNRLRFEINRQSAEAAGLTISSQVLKLATRVVRE